MSMRTIIILLLTAIWFLFCHYRYTCVHRQMCWGDKVAVARPTAPTADMAPGKIVFEADKEAKITSGDLQPIIDSIMAGNTNDNLLEIIGAYYPSEPKPEGFENMGLARADQVKGLLKGKIPDERIRVSANLLEGDVPADPFAAFDFNWKKVEVDKVEVVKTADGANIYFPFGQAKKETDPKIDEYLKQVAQRVKQSGEKINLTGHTDNKGTEVANQKLGMDRAREIRRILIGHGVNRNQINIESKGESAPVSTNETDEGRHQNRRVELKITA